MKKFVAIVLLIVIALMIILSMVSCVSYKSCPAYAGYYKYEYRNVSDDSVKIKYLPMLEYLPGDVFTLYPECRDILILSVEKNGTKLTLPKKL